MRPGNIYILCIYTTCTYAREDKKLDRANLRLVACPEVFPIENSRYISNFLRQTFRFLLSFLSGATYVYISVLLVFFCASCYTYRVLCFLARGNFVSPVARLAVNHVPTMGLVFKVPACNCTRPFVGAQGTHARPRDTKYRGHSVETFTVRGVKLTAVQSCCNVN